MSVSFDAGDALLRLDADAFIALVEYATDPQSACDDIARLVDAGAVEDGLPHPVLRGPLAAVTSCVGSLQVLVTGPRGVHLHQAWVALVSAMLTDLGDGTYDFAAVSTDFLPAAIAQQTGLQARPRLDPETVGIDEQLLDDLASNTTAARRAGSQALADLLVPWPRAYAAVRAGLWQLAVVDIAFQAPGRTVVRRLAWVDADAGLLRVEADDHGAALVPTTSTALWRAIVSILPTDAEITPVPQPA